jgi:hypothetical protein
MLGSMLCTTMRATADVLATLLLVALPVCLWRPPQVCLSVEPTAGCLCVCGGHRRSTQAWAARAHPPRVWTSPATRHSYCGNSGGAGSALEPHCCCRNHSCAAAAGGLWAMCLAGATLSSHSARCHRYRFSAGCGGQATGCCRTALCFNTLRAVVVLLYLLTPLCCPTARRRFLLGNRPRSCPLPGGYLLRVQLCCKMPC